MRPYQPGLTRESEWKGEHSLLEEGVKVYQVMLWEGQGWLSKLCEPKMKEGKEGYENKEEQAPPELFEK